MESKDLKINALLLIFSRLPMHFKAEFLFIKLVGNEFLTFISVEMLELFLSVPELALLLAFFSNMEEQGCTPDHHSL